MNQELIKKLAAGEIAVKNDGGTLEQLREVLKAAFPGDKKPNGSFKYYQKLMHNDRLWCCVDHATIPSHSISDFYTEDQPEFVRGELVEVRDLVTDVWEERIYLTTIEGSSAPYLCVTRNDEDLFKENKPFGTISWQQIRKLQPKQIEVTLEEIAAWKGCKPEQIVIV